MNYLGGNIKLKKRFLAILLTLAMVFSLAQIVFASTVQEKPDNGTIADYYTVTVTDGITVKIELTGVGSNIDNSNEDATSNSLLKLVIAKSADVPTSNFEGAGDGAWSGLGWEEIYVEKNQTTITKTFTGLVANTEY